jgi:hypothetical protein
MDRSKGKAKRSPSPKRKLSSSPRNGNPRSKSPSRKTSPKPIGPRRRVAPFPVNYNIPMPIPTEKAELQQLYQDTLKFLMNR